MSNNKQEIVKRIEEITEEIGLTSNSVGGGGSVSLRDLSEQIIQKLTSTSSSDINGKVLDIFNKIQTIYNWSSNTDTKTNQIYTWFSNIYNELNSTSTSYMKGKINSIYSWSSSINNKVNNIHSEVTSSSSSSVSGQLQSIYDKIVSSGSGGGIKSVQIGYSSGVISSPSSSSEMFLIHHSQVNINKSFVILDIAGQVGINSSGYNAAATGRLNSRSPSSFYLYLYSSPASRRSISYSWQLIEFY